MATFTNQATLSYNNTVTNSNITTAELVEVLTAAKSAVGTTYSTGDTITYIVSLVNSGTAAFTGLNLSDDLGGYEFNTGTVYPLSYVTDSVRYYVNGVIQATPTVTAGPPLTISGISVPAGGNAQIIYQATVNSYASPEIDSLIENTATISGANLSTPISASDTIVAETEPILSINKSVSPSTVSENGQITYTFLLQNYGNTEVLSTGNAIVSDVFTPALSDISVTFNSTAWTLGTNYTYSISNGSGTFATITGQMAIPAATFTQNTQTGEWVVTPGVSTLVVTGTI